MKTQNLSISAILTVVLFAVCFIFFEIRYETNDDLAMSLIAKGYFTGSPDYHLVFINTLVGKFLVFLYSIIPTINWYAYLLVFLQFISVFAINYGLLNLDKNKYLLVATFLFPSSYFLINFQFTHISFLLAFAGILLFLANEDDSKILHFLSVFLLFLSSLIRFEMFAVTLILGGVFMLKHPKTKNTGVALLALSFLVGFAQIYHARSYQDADWEVFKKFNKVRGKVNDNPNVWPNLEGLTKKLELDESEIKLYLKAIYTDRFDTPKITEAYNYVNDGQNGWYALSQLPEYYVYHDLLSLSLLILVVLAFYYDKSILIPGVMITILLVIILLDATPKTRVIFGAMLTVIILSTISLQKFNISRIYFGLICLLLISYFSIQISYLNNPDSINTSELQDGKCYIAINPSNMASGRDTTPFAASSLESKDIILGGWLTNSPLMIKQFENLGVSVSPHISLIDNDSINKQCLYIDRNNPQTEYLFMALKRRFMKRGKTIEVVSKSKDLIIYQIKKEE